MTTENQPPSLTGISDAKPVTRDNILLNWIVLLAGLGAITLIAIFLTDFL